MKKTQIMNMFIAMIIFFGVFFSFTSESEADGKYLLLTTAKDFGNFSLDKDSFYWLKKDNDHYYFDTWIEVKYNNNGVRTIVNSRQNSGLPLNGYNKIDYSLLHIVYASENKQLFKKTYCLVHYDSDGNVLDRSKIEDTQWKPLAPIDKDIILKVMEYISKQDIEPSQYKDWQQYQQ